MINKLYYTLSNSGLIVKCGYSKYFGIEVTNEPFTNIEEAFNYRKNLETNEWIYDPIIMIPQEISKLQAVSYLLQIDKYNDLITALDSDETGVKRILFDAAHVLYRSSNMVNEIANALGMTTEEDKDNLFIEANKILL